MANSDVISARESEVARLYVGGLSYKEIARDLDISPATVRTHLNTIYRKLSVTSRIELLHRLADMDAGEVPDAPMTAAKPESVAERRHLTVMFVDLVGSTAIAAGIDAEDMHELLQAYRTTVRSELEAFGGHPAGFPGDGVVACFGWPKAYEDAAERAVRAGLAIVDAVAGLRTPDGKPLKARVGIATGVVVVDGKRGDSDSLTGGTPNLAARLQTVAEPGGIVIASETRDLIRDLFEIEDLGPRQIKGLPSPVPVFRVVGGQDAGTRFEARQMGRPQPMIGRDMELALLAERWTRARNDEGQAALLTGEPGIGKSRIAAALLDRAVDDGGTVLRFQTSPQQGDSPLWPVRRQLMIAADLENAVDDRDRLHRLERILAVSGPVSSEMVAVLAELLDISNDTPLPAMSAERRRERIIGMLVKLCLRLADRAPVLVLFEDLHWIDPNSHEFLESLIGQIEAARIMLVLTSRPEGEPHFAGHPHLTRITLNRLGKADAAAMVRGIVGNRQLDRAVFATILDRTDGVPLYLEEMTQAILETSADAGSVPASLHDLLMARLDRLDDAKELAQVAACIGREFDHDLLEAVADSDAAGLARAIDRLVAAELVFRRGPGYLFKHALVQDVAQQSLMRARRAELHGRIAEALLGRFPVRAADEPQTVAHHLESAGRFEAAADYYARAADLANYKGANREARRYLERSLRLIEGLPPSAERDRREVAALTMLGKIVVAIDGHASPAAAEVYNRALHCCREAGLGLEEFPLVLGLTVQAAVSGDVHKALDLAERLGELAEGAEDPILAVEADYALGITHSWRGDLRLARRHLEAGSRCYHPDHHSRHVARYGQDPGVVCGCRGAMTLWLMGYPDRAATEFAASLKLARQLGHSLSINYVLNWIAVHAVEMGVFEPAERAVTASLDHADEHGFGIWSAMGHVSRARLVLQHGTPAVAIAECENAVSKVRATGTGCVEAQILGVWGDALCRLGRASEGLEKICEAMRLIEFGGARWCEVEILRQSAACHCDLGDQAAAEAVLTNALELSGRQGARMLELRVARDLANLWSERGERQLGRSLIEDRVADFTEGYATRDLIEAKQQLNALSD